MPYSTGGVRMPGARGANFQAKGTYSFAVSGGAVGTIALPGASIPSGAIVRGGWINVITPPTSGGAATVSVGVEAAGDLQAAAVISGAPWSTVGRKNVTPGYTGATSIATTAARSISIAVAVAALTAGVFEVYVDYVMP